MVTPKTPLTANVVKGLRLIVKSVEVEIPITMLVPWDSKEWGRYIEPAVDWMYEQYGKPTPIIQCPDCKAKLRRGTSLASHLRNCPYGPRLLRRRKPEKPQ